MQGLWNVRTETISPGVAAIVFDAFLSVAAFIFAVVALDRPSKQWPDARNLQFGVLVLWIWSVMNLIHMVIRGQHGSVYYSYIILQPIFKIFRVLSEVFIIWGMWSVRNRYDSLRRTKENASRYALSYYGAFALLVLSIYHACFFFATAITWTSFASLSTINSLAYYSGSFEVAYVTVYFVLLLMMNAAVNFPVLRDGIPTVSPNYQIELGAWCGSLVGLTFRSFCEVIVVGRLNDSPADIASIYDAREIAYSICTIFFLCHVPFSIPPKKRTDPLVEKEREFAEKKAAAQLEAADGVSTWLVQEMGRAAGSGTRTAPTVSALLTRLEDHLESQNEEDDEYKTLGVKKEEIKRLRDLYADWEPIFRDYKDYPQDVDHVYNDNAERIEGIP